MRACHTPDQEPVDKLLLLLQVSGPVPLDVSVELILQRVAVVFSAQFRNLKHRYSAASINQHRRDTMQQRRERPSGVKTLPRPVNLQIPTYI